ncbi:MAG TPA: IS1380 family transposase [Planctomycetota bacterium]|nr:IS1380 family transposase [Planctomycetota bacterium]
MARSKRQSVLFEDLYDKPAEVTFTGPRQSSDGGVILLDAMDRRMGLIRRIAQAVHDPRQQGKITYDLEKLIRERIFLIACGYPRCDDADRLVHDPALKMVSHLREGRLASQPTLSRFENEVTRTDLFRIGLAITDTVIDCERRKRVVRNVRRITIDMDPTDDPTYGDQQLTFFNAFYDTWCYLPMVTTIQFGDEAEQYQVAPVLRPGNAKGSLGAIGILKRLVPRLRKTFPYATLVVRMDGAFATPEVFAWLEAHDLLYLVNMAKNSVLEAEAEPLMKEVRTLAKAVGCTITFYSETRYQAGTWEKTRRSIIKAEVVVNQKRELRDNPRFVITNLSLIPQNVYRYYRERGDAENRIKELHHDLRFDLTSCTSFQANQLRNLLTGAAYALYQQLRYAARRTELGRAQVGTLRERLIKVGTVIKESVRRILLEMPQPFAWYDTWTRLARSLGAIT